MTKKIIGLVWILAFGAVIYYGIGYFRPVLLVKNQDVKNMASYKKFSFMDAGYQSVDLRRDNPSVIAKKKAYNTLLDGKKADAIHYGFIALIACITLGIAYLIFFRRD